MFRGGPTRVLCEDASRALSGCRGSVVVGVRGASPGSAEATSGWWDARWDYRFTVTVNAAAVPRSDVLAAARVDLAAMLGANGTPDLATLRVVEVDEAGLVSDGPRAAQFDADLVDGTAGRLIFPVDGTIAAGATRSFHVYLNPVGSAVPAVAPTLNLSQTGSYMTRTSVGPLEARPTGTPALHGGGFVAVAPTRLLDTRDGSAPAVAALEAGTAHRMAVRGRAGVPMTATAAVINVTVVDSTEAAFLRVWPATEPMPQTSSINADAHDVVANLVTTVLGEDGAVLLALSDGSAHLAVDLVGYYAPEANGGYHPVTPLRALDTRSAGGHSNAVGPEGTVTVDLAAALGVAGSEIAAVALNVTAVSPSVGGYLTVVPGGTSPLPTVSNLNFGAGQTVPNAVTVATDGAGRITVFNRFGTTHVVLDVVGWYDTDGSGARFHALAPTRVTDTRRRPGRAPVQVGEIYTASVAGGRPAFPPTPWPWWATSPSPRPMAGGT